MLIISFKRLDFVMGVLISKKVFCSRVMLDTNLFDEERRFRKRVFVYLSKDDCFIRMAISSLSCLMEVF